MLIETERLVIRDVEAGDARPFAEMAADGSLRDIGFDGNCGGWMANWVEEAKALAARDCPDSEYLAYTVVRKDDGVVIGSVGCSYYKDLCEIGITYFIGAQYRKSGYAAEAASAYAGYFLAHYPSSRIIAAIRADNVSSWKTVEKAGFHLVEKRQYKDLYDGQAELYRFYERGR